MDNNDKRNRHVGDSVPSNPQGSQRPLRENYSRPDSGNGGNGTRPEKSIIRK